MTNAYLCYANLYFALHIQLKICDGARVLLTYNIHLQDRLLNGSTGTVVCLQIPRASDSLHGTIYVKFDNPGAGKSHRNPYFVREELGDCVPIIATLKRFSYCHKIFLELLRENNFLLDLHLPLIYIILKALI